MRKKVFPNGSLHLKKEIYGYVVKVFIGKIEIFSNVTENYEKANELYKHLLNIIDEVFIQATEQIKEKIGGKKC